jgi:ABC-type transport system involved in cytochrome c biogenesis permease subunit
VATLVAIYYLVKQDESVLRAIDNLLGGGIALFTVGMLTGSLWAKQAWGEDWSWDAKEAWAAATWFLYLAAIHLRLLRVRATKTFCALLIVAFLSLQMCWYGVNYLPSAAKSVHTYNQ